METNLHTRSTQRKSSYPHPQNKTQTHHPLAIPLRPRTSPLRFHRTLTTNNQYPQIRMSDVGRPPMGRHQRHLRRKSERRTRVPRCEQFLGRRSRSGGGRQRRRRGHAEHFYRRPRTGERLGNGRVSLPGEFKSRSYRRRVCNLFCSLKILIIQTKQTISRPPLPRIATVLHTRPAGDVIQHVREWIARRHVQPILVRI